MRRISLEQLKTVLKDLPDNPRVVVSGNFAMPKALMAAFDAQVPRYRLHMLNAQLGIPRREGVSHESAFIGPGMRNYEDLTYIPSRLSLLPVLIKNHLKPDIVLIHTSLPRFDTVSLGTEVNILPAAIESVRSNGGIVIAQANSHMPYTYGDSQIYENEIDFLVEVDEELATHNPIALPEIARTIGELIAEHVRDGSTLQMGIGAVPDAVLDLLKERKGLRVWTEMFSDGVLALSNAGALDEEILITAAFVFGSQELYQWLDLNKKVRMLRTERTNDPSQIARQAQMTSINSALEVDLFDQANASHVRGKIYSGFGGSTDFIVGALHSRGGQSFVALPSWHPKAKVSTIVPRLQSNITHFQHSFVVTEQGVAACFGHSQTDQAINIIHNAAHPDVREELISKAGEYGLL